MEVPGDANGTLSVLQPLKYPAVFRKIIMLAIGGDESRWSEDLAALRLVSSECLEWCSKLLKQQQNSCVEFYIGADKESRREFIKYIKIFSSDFPQSTLPIRIIFQVEFFVRKNSQILFDFLTKCERHLKELELELPRAGSKMLKIRNKLNLSSLEKITISFSNGEKLAQEALRYGIHFLEERYQRAPVELHLLQAIFDGCRRLHCLELATDMDVSPFPKNFGTLLLPLSLQCVHFDCELQDEFVHLFQHNTGLKIRRLRFQQNEEPLENLSRIVATTRECLKILEITGLQPTGFDDRQPTVLNLPTMDTLSSIEICSSDLMLETGERRIRNIFPNLSSLKLAFHPPAFLKKWFEIDGFRCVKTICFSSVNPGLVQDDPFYYLSSGSEIIEKIDLACPTLEELTYLVTFDDLSSFPYIFRNMQRLKKLDVSFMGYIPAVAAQIIESTMLQIPLAMAVSLREFGYHIERVELINNFPCIRQMTGLKLLTFGTPGQDVDPAQRIVTPLLVQQGFERMNGLEVLKLNGRFGVDPRMMTYWQLRQ